nr:hypothetical protein [Tanacetum cinerariifolium]
MWEAIKSRFGSNDKSKKMQKYLLKQQFESFSVSSSEGLHKGYDRFQTLLRDDNHGDRPETSTPPVPSQTQQIPHIVSSIKLPILKKGEYDIWAMKMEHYLCYIDYPIWQVIQNGNGPVSVIIDTHGVIKVLPLKTAEEEMWEAIKSRFGSNDESKKMQKYLLKQQFEGFSVSSSEGLHKGYDRSLPSSWSQVALIMRIKPGLDTLSFDDLYNNLRVFEHDVKGTTTSSTTTQNMAFVSGESTSSTNNVSTAYSVSSPSVSKSQQEGFSSYTDEVIHSFFSNQSSTPQLDYDDLEAKGNRRDAGYNGNKARDSSRRPAYQEELNALGTIDEEDIDWSVHVEEDAKNYAMMAYSSNTSGSDSEESDLENTLVNDRYVKRMHAVPPPMTGNYMPSRPNVEIDYSKFTYGPKQTSVDDLNIKSNDYATCESNSSEETPTSVPEPIKNKTKVVSKPRV